MDESLRKKRPADARPRSRRKKPAQRAAGAGAAAAGGPPGDSRWPDCYLVPAVCGLLLLAVALVFGRTAAYEFVNYDDNVYVYDNLHVAPGLTSAGIAWAFTQSHAGNWHPLTWLSHMLDCQVYGLLRPGGHHLTSVLLHAAVTVLLFLVLRQMTGRLWPSALAAALFAVHPLRVESVAWVAERKDLLSGMFFMLTLMAYVGYARRRFSPGRYLLVLLLFSLGLMAKPMLVTLPFVLLLLDYWPLARFTSALERVILEKVPLAALAAAAGAVTLRAQTQGIAPLAVIPWSARLANVPAAYAGYLRQFFFPADLAVFYPHPAEMPPLWQTAGAVLVLAAICVAAWLARRRCPYLLTGWLWYLGMLVPVIGIVQAGSQAMADRYTYLPQIGLCIALAWGIAALCAFWPYRLVYGAAAAIALAILTGCACRQTAFWRNSETLWRRDLACAGPNALAELNLGLALKQQGRLTEAIAHYRRGLDLKPDSFEGHNQLGVALAMQGQIDEAIEHLRLAVAIDPTSEGAQHNLERARSLKQTIALPVPRD